VLYSSSVAVNEAGLNSCSCKSDKLSGCVLQNFCLTAKFVQGGNNLLTCRMCEVGAIALTKI